MSADAAKFAGKHFPDKYTVAFTGLTETSAQLYESGTIDSLYYYPMYDLGINTVSHIDKLIQNEHERRVKYVPVNRFDAQGNEKTLLERCKDNSLFSKYYYSND